MSKDSIMEKRVYDERSRTPTRGERAPAMKLKAATATQISTIPPTNIPSARDYSPKNTLIGRVDMAANRKTGIHRATVKIALLEDIVRETFLRDQMIEEHFK